MAPSAWSRYSLDDQQVYMRMINRLVDLEVYLVEVEEGAIGVDDFYAPACDEVEELRACLSEAGLLDD